MKTLYYYTSPHCGPCRQVGPVFERLKQELSSETYFVKIDVEQDRIAAVNAGVSKVPTFHLYEDGVKLRERVGLSSETQLRELITG